jgi:ElaB/YqjD/DUF883 family membrane-anchored ribosome-binding protein
MAKTKDEASGQDNLTAQASSKMQEATSVAQEKGSELREQGSVRLREQFDKRSTELGSQVRSVAEALRHSGDDVGSQENGNAAQLTDQAADRLERFGVYLEQKSGDDFMRDVEGFARRRPWMLAGLGLLGGVAAARFVKASSEKRYSAYRGSNEGYSTSQPEFASQQDNASSLASGSDRSGSRLESEARPRGAEEHLAEPSPTRSSR